MTIEMFECLVVGDIVIGTNIGRNPIYGGIKFKVVGFYYGHGNITNDRYIIQYDDYLGKCKVYGKPVCKPLDDIVLHITKESKRSMIPDVRNGKVVIFYSNKSIKFDDNER